MKLKVFYSSAQGASHKKKNKECQDWSGSYCDEKCAIAIVCDGHGGDDYVRSGIGSKIACEVAKKDIINFIDTVKLEDLNKNSNELLERLEASIISGWSGSIQQDFAERPFADDELKNVSEKAKAKYRDGEIEGAYGTTLIAVAMTKDYWFGLQIGDGKCVAVTKESQLGKPIPRNEKCFLNATTSICDKDALINFRHRYSQKLPAAIFVGSDGVDDSFSNDEQLYGLYRTIVYSFATTDFDEAKKDLEKYLPGLSKKGSGDDVSIAAIFDMDAIAELSIVKDFDPEKEKERIAEAERKQKEEEQKRAEERRQKEEERKRERVKQQEEERRKKEASAAGRQARPNYCQYCGSKLFVGEGSFCPGCGKPVMENPISGEVNASNGKTAFIVPPTVIPKADAASKVEIAVISENTDPESTVLENTAPKNKVMGNESGVKEVSGQKASGNETADKEMSENKISEDGISENETIDEEISKDGISENELSKNEVSENEISENEPSDKQNGNDISQDNTECENDTEQEAPLPKDIQDSISGTPDNDGETLEKAVSASTGILYGD